MPSFAKVQCLGHLGRDPELKYTPKGDAVCTFSMAVSEKRGEAESVTWFRVSVWGKSAESASKYLAKGSMVFVEGRLRSEEYTDREGNRRTSLEVRANDVTFLDRREKASAAGASAQQSAIDDDSLIPF